MTPVKDLHRALDPSPLWDVHVEPWSDVVPKDHGSGVETCHRGPKSETDLVHLAGPLTKSPAHMARGSLAMALHLLMRTHTLGKTRDLSRWPRQRLLLRQCEVVDSQRTLRSACGVPVDVPRKADLRRKELLLTRL